MKLTDEQLERLHPKPKGSIEISHKDYYNGEFDKRMKKLKIERLGEEWYFMEGWKEE